jgi:hypothetical protein
LLFDLLADWLPGAVAHKLALVDNPAVLYPFNEYG